MFTNVLVLLTVEDGFVDYFNVFLLHGREYLELYKCTVIWICTKIGLLKQKMYQQAMLTPACADQRNFYISQTNTSVRTQI